MRRVLVIGGSFAGLCVARDMATHFLVTIVDCKEFFEYTPGILRCFVKPKHFDALSFNLQPVIEDRMGCKFIWGEVTELRNDRTAKVKPMFSAEEEVIDFDFCIICSGCNFGPFKPKGESLWFPTVHDGKNGRAVSEWKQFDERFIEGRRRHIFAEYNAIGKLRDEKAEILVVGAGFIGVEWVTELEYFFGKSKTGQAGEGVKLSIMDMLERPLGPLPDGAARYCTKYMERHGIRQYYKTYERDGKVMKKGEAGGKDVQLSWQEIGLPASGPNKSYVCVGVKASNYFMPEDTLSQRMSDNDDERNAHPICTHPTGGPMGGKWILVDQTLAVITAEKDTGPNSKNGQIWCKDEKGYARVYAVGDCNYGCIEPKNKWKLCYKGKLVEGKPTPGRLIELDPKVTKTGAPDGWTLQDNQMIVKKTTGDWPVPPIPKISYPGEEEAVIAARNVEKTDHLYRDEHAEDCFGYKQKIHNMHWPWGAGMFATSLGPHDACFVVAANWTPKSGFTVLWGSLSAVQKEFIEHSKTDECGMGFLGRAIWHFVHHTPVHLWGGGPRWGY